jgi:NitT/TauT family transport system substrate-binding protein
MNLLRGLAALLIASTLAGQACAEERVTVGTTRAAANAALFVAAGSGYFRAEELNVDLRVYPDAQQVAAALATGALDFAATEFTAPLFKLAAGGSIKAVAALAQEKRDFEGGQIVASNGAYGRGLRKPENISGHSIAIGEFGTPPHYQIGQVARSKRFELKNVILKPMQSNDAIAAAVNAGQVDAAILPAQHARELLTASQAKLVGWISEFDEQQIGALVASSKMLQTRRPVAEKFVRAYQRGVADFSGALLRRDRYGKRIVDSRSNAMSAMIARYVFPSHTPARAAGVIEASVYFIEAQARLDAADIQRQADWYKAQGLLDTAVDARAFVDPSLLGR